MTSFTESTIEQAAIDWLKGLGYDYAFGPDLAFDGVIDTLANLRDALLPKMMRGEVRVK
jgi:type I restriction enzyme R subunit